MLKFITCSDTAFLVALGDTINQEVHTQVIAFYNTLKQSSPKGVVALVPTYCAVMVVYDPIVTSPNRLQSQLQYLADCTEGDNLAPNTQVIEIPVCYGGDYGPDLTKVAQHCGLTPEEIIELHSGVEYPIFMIGLSPGFPFLGGLDPKLHTPRLGTPRTRVPAGSIGIADAQTGIYPVESPGEWQLIGRTPLQLFRPKHAVPFRYQVGDRLRFVSIEKEEYLEIQTREAA